MVKNNRQQQAYETKQKLIEAALQLFSQKGVKESTVKEIAKKAGVTEGLIYHYFSSKEELLQSVMETYTINNTLQEVTSKLDPHLSLEKQLQIYFHSMFTSMHEYEAFLVMCFGEAQRNAKIHKFVDKIIQKGIQQLMQHISMQININPYPLQIAVQNLLNSTFLYFILFDRFQTDPEKRLNYVKESVYQFIYFIKGHGEKKNEQ
jgi:AcrR family transcriptional regulator